MPVMRPFSQLLLFRLRTFYRDPGVIFWVYGFPIAMTAVFGLAFRPGPGGATPVGVVGDRAAAVRAELASPEVSVREFPGAEDADRALGRGEVALVVVADEPPVYRFDATRAEGRTARLLVDALLERARGRRDLFVPRIDDAPRGGLRYVDFLVPGLIGLLLMNTTLWGVGFSFVDLRARRNLKLLAATPMPRSQLLAAQVLSRLLGTLAMAAATLAFGVLAFGTQVRGSLVEAALVVILGGLAFSGIALLAGSRTKSTETAHGILTVVAVPMSLCSGVFFSTTGYPLAAGGFPGWLRALVAPLPLTLVNDALRAIVNDGASLGSMPGTLALLAAWGLVPFAIAVRVFRWT